MKVVSWSVDRFVRTKGSIKVIYHSTKRVQKMSNWDFQPKNGEPQKSHKLSSLVESELTEFLSPPPYMNNTDYRYESWADSKKIQENAVGETGPNVQILLVLIVLLNGSVLR